MSLNTNALNLIALAATPHPTSDIVDESLLEFVADLLNGNNHLDLEDEYVIAKTTLNAMHGYKKFPGAAYQSPNNTITAVMTRRAVAIDEYLVESEGSVAETVMDEAKSGIDLG